MRTTAKPSPRKRLAARLGDVTGTGSFSARRTAPTDDLHLEVRGVGPVRLPVSPAQARQLCRVARPARYGHGSPAGLDALASYCRRRVRERLAQPPRAADDWSITTPDGCGCDVCCRLGVFLADPTQQLLEWPLAKPHRAHVHQTIDRAELPVRHRTRRSGRPYTLVLTKSDELFEQEARLRRRHQADLDWLDGQSAPV